MMAEDAADRYLITGLENRTTNRLVIILARSFLNPGRSFANVMAFHLPWRRDNRLGLLGEDFVLRKELVAEYKAGGEKPFVYERPPNPQFERTYPKEANIELTAFMFTKPFAAEAVASAEAARARPVLTLTFSLSAKSVVVS